MKLSSIERLLAQLALQVTAGELDDLKFQCHDLNQIQKDQATSAIRLFEVLRQTSGDTESFLRMLTRLFSGLEHFGKHLSIVQAFDRHSECLESAREKETLTRNVSDEQKFLFRKTLASISAKMQKSKLEIMVVLSPLPRGCKDNLREGYKLFDELKMAGYIAESNVELLEDFFDVLGMKDATDLLRQYKNQGLGTPRNTEYALPVATPPSWSPIHSTHSRPSSTFSAQPGRFSRL